MIRALLIDDEMEGLNVLEYDIKRLNSDIQIIGKFNDPKLGLDAIQQLKPDLVFLDIEMPWMNGFELLDQIDSIDFKVIFVTAYDQYAIKAFRYYAVDYLLKPVSQDQLRDAINRVQSKDDRLDKNMLQALMHKLDREDEPITKIAIPTMEGYSFLEIASIIRCEADNNYCNVFLVDGKKILVSRPLKYLTGLLSQHQFFRLHQSHLINLNHIDRYVKGDGGYVIMSDGSHVSIARSKRDDFVAIIRKTS